MAQLDVTPKEINVEGPFEESKVTKFSLQNEYPRNQVFKIKSTGPERIRIDPNCGFIRAFDRTEVD